MDSGTIIWVIVIVGVLFFMMKGGGCCGGGRARRKDENNGNKQDGEPGNGTADSGADKENKTGCH